MTIEAEIENNTKELRQLTILVENILQVIQSLSGKPLPIQDYNQDVTVTGDGIGIVLPILNDPVNITLADFGELDAMKCPHDPQIMSGNKTKHKNGKMAGCWKKKKDAAYTEEMYLAERRVLIAKVEAVMEDMDDGESVFNDDDQTRGQQTLPQSAAPPQAGAPPPLQQLVAPADLPVINDVSIITTAEFENLCRAFIVKHSDPGAKHLSQKMLACSLGPEITPDQVTQQDILTWIANQVIDYDATNA